MPNERSPFTVIGLWDGDAADRWAECFLTNSGPQAEQLARIWADENVPDAELVIAGVVRGDAEVVA